MTASIAEAYEIEPESLDEPIGGFPCLFRIRMDEQEVDITPCTILAGCVRAEQEAFNEPGYGILEQVPDIEGHRPVLAFSVAKKSLLAAEYGLSGSRRNVNRFEPET